jgi:hypothetical protein
MSVLLLQVDGEPFVAAVSAAAIDAGEDPDAIEEYVAAVQESVLVRDLQRDPRVRYCLVDVDRVAELGPQDIALMLTQDGRDEYGFPDLPQAWETLP